VILPVEAFPVRLQKAKKRAIRQTEKKLKEQYEIAEVSVFLTISQARRSVESAVLQRNVTAKGYIQSVARIMGIDMTPFRE
jgi:hypothetical protein